MDFNILYVDTVIYEPSKNSSPKITKIFWLILTLLIIDVKIMNISDFIELYKSEDPIKLLLSLKQEDFSFDLKWAVNQIECRQKQTKKLSEFISNPLFLFPDTLAAEQASHQVVARYHASLISGNQKILDMTSGLGIDSLSLAAKNNVTSLELDSLRAETLSQNAKVLNIDSITVINADSVEFLKNTNTVFDLIFIDPARRDNTNKKVYNLHDCLPDVINIQNLLLEKSEKILIKASPMLDISQTVRDFSPHLNSIRAVGVKGECKEILIELSLNHEEPILFEAVNLAENGEKISVFKSDPSCLETIPLAKMDDLEKGYYLLEPSAMVMKLSPWKEICRDFKALKLGKSSNIFISKIQPDNFPGRVTQLEKILKKSDKKELSGSKATIVSKNHPLPAEEIRKIYQLKEGNEIFIYATKIGEKPIMLRARPTIFVKAEAD